MEGAVFYLSACRLSGIYCVSALKADGAVVTSGGSRYGKRCKYITSSTYFFARVDFLGAGAFLAFVTFFGFFAFFAFTTTAVSSHGSTETPNR